MNTSLAPSRVSRPARLMPVAPSGALPDKAHRSRTSFRAACAGLLDATGHATFSGANGFHGDISVDAAGHVVASVTPPLSSSSIALTGSREINRLVNLSTRGDVGTGDNMLISGFVVAGTCPKKMLIRVIGPSLSAYSVSNALADPRIDITRMSDHAVISSADNWGESGDAAELTNAMSAAGAFPIPDGS